MEATKNMKKIMVLAGGNDQAALIDELRRQLDGHVHIILVDMNPKAKAVPSADLFLPISTMDREAVLQSAKEHEIDMIITACGDQPMSTMTYVSQQLGLPCYLSSQLVKDLTNKKYMKHRMIECDIPTSKFFTANSPHEVNHDKLTDLNFPIVIKPVDSNGSKGVKKVNNHHELQRHIPEAFKYSISGDIILEEFNEGPELSIDVYVENGIAKVLSVIELDKIRENTDSFTIVQSHYPPSFDINMEEVSTIAQKIALGFNLDNTPLLIQAIHTKNGLKVIEFSARMGGGSKFKSIMHYTGVDIMKVYVEMILGKKPSVKPKKNIKHGSMCYVYCKPGVFDHIEGLDNLIENNSIDFYYTYKTPNSEILKSDTSSDRVAGFMVSGDTHEDVSKKIKHIDGVLQVLDPNGYDIMKHNLYR